MTTIVNKPQLPGIAQLLVDEKWMSLETALNYQKQAEQGRLPFLHLLIHLNIIDSQKLALLVAQNYGLPFFDLDFCNKSEIPNDLFDEKTIQKYRFFPLVIIGAQLYLAIDDPAQFVILKELKLPASFHPQLVIVETPKLSLLIHQSSQKILSEQKKNYVYSDENESETDAPIIQLVNQIIKEAIRQRASDIHFEPYENEYRIRYRIDGQLIKVETPPADLIHRISVRIKIMASLDISERRIPQDGRIQMTYSSSKKVDLRVSTCPTIEGEKIVVRILDSTIAKLDINQLGFNEQQKILFINTINKPQGMILVTGPTGSGKTLTLYNALKILNTEQINISSVEDPVEIKMLGINQVSINPKIGFTFDSVLRTFLRQDPDVIMVGEIRDNETAEMAMKAAQTGHLLLSTLHTNSAAETLTRLLNLGIPAFNIASSVSLLIAQRLVRKLCHYCKIHDSEHYSFNRTGCNHCINGYRGRVGLFEVMPISKTIQQMIMAGHNSIEIYHQALTEGMQTLYQSGLEKIQLGITTLEEVNRVTNL